MAASPLVISSSDHNISCDGIGKNALKVLHRLKDAGYDAYLVGGGVRDLLLGLQPKDFDIVTNALPEQVRKLFRNCILIGRRFRLMCASTKTSCGFVAENSTGWGPRNR